MRLRHTLIQRYGDFGTGQTAHHAQCLVISLNWENKEYLPTCWKEKRRCGQSRIWPGSQIQPRLPVAGLNLFRAFACEWTGVSHSRKGCQRNGQHSPGKESPEALHKEPEEPRLRNSCKPNFRANVF